jgi:MOSC domain-containing protein YiiM
MSGSIVSIQLCVGHRDPMKTVESANMREGFGIEGDRHAVSEGVRTARQVLLIDQETLERLGLSRGQVRENVTTSGIDLHSLQPGQCLALGEEAVVEITGHCAPCGRMDEIRDGLREVLEGQRGMLATVLRGGAIAVGHPVSVRESAAV